MLALPLRRRLLVLLCLPGMAIAQGADLVPTGLTADTITGTGQQITATLTMLNQGTEATQGTYSWWYNEYWLSADTSLGSGDTLLAQPRFYGGLNAGQTGTETLALAMPFVAGTYYLIAVVDKVNATNTVPESDETNNTIVFGPIEVRPSDLVAVSLTADTLTGTGQAIAATLTMRNDGPGDARSQYYNWWYNEYWLSANTTLDSGDTLLDQPRHYATVAPGETTVQAVSLAMPYVAGTYYLIAKVDKVNATDTVDETDETNNTLVFGPIEVRPSDLEAVSVSGPTQALPGTPVDLTFTMRNNGPGNARSRYYTWWYNEYWLSTDPTLGGGDSLLGQPRHYATLLPGVTDSQTLTVTLPTTPGRYYVIAIADKVNATQTVDETDETNNTFVFGPILVADDQDGDGHAALEDCNDADATIYPGAPEVMGDGIDQDCNGFDLTFQVVSATYASGQDDLRVVAVSAQGAAANLAVTGYGPLVWKSAQEHWEASFAPAGGNPGFIEVCDATSCLTVGVSTWDWEQHQFGFVDAQGNPLFPAEDVALTDVRTGDLVFLRLVFMDAGDAAQDVRLRLRVYSSQADFENDENYGYVQAQGLGTDWEYADVCAAGTWCDGGAPVPFVVTTDHAPLPGWVFEADGTLSWTPGQGNSSGCENQFNLRYVGTHGQGKSWWFRYEADGVTMPFSNMHYGGQKGLTVRTVP